MRLKKIIHYKMMFKLVLSWHVDYYIEFFSLRAENYKYEKTISIYQQLRIVLTLSSIVLMRLNKDVANFTHII